MSLTFRWRALPVCLLPALTDNIFIFSHLLPLKTTSEDFWLCPCCVRAPRLTEGSYPSQDFVSSCFSCPLFSLPFSLMLDGSNHPLTSPGLSVPVVPVLVALQGKGGGTRRKCRCLKPTFKGIEKEPPPLFSPLKATWGLPAWLWALQESGVEFHL